jgi:putative transposase
MPSSHHGILLHIVFSTKNRMPLILPSWQDDLYAYMGGIAKEHKAIVLCSGGVEDHVHLLVKTHPSFAIADTVQLMKSNSSRWVNQSQKTTIKFQWQRGYGVFSVSQSQSEIVKLSSTFDLRPSIISVERSKRNIWKFFAATE